MPRRVFHTHDERLEAFRRIDVDVETGHVKGLF